MTDGDMEAAIFCCCSSLSTASKKRNVDEEEGNNGQEIKITRKGSKDNFNELLRKGRLGLNERRVVGQMVHPRGEPNPERQHESY